MAPWLLVLAGASAGAAPDAAGSGTQARRALAPASAAQPAADGAPAAALAPDPGAASRRDLAERERLLREQLERERARAALERLRRDNAAVLRPVPVQPAVPLPPAAPPPITTCDGAGCWDASGRRYNQGAGSSFFRSDGRVCQQVGAVMQCP